MLQPDLTLLAECGVQPHWVEIAFDCYLCQMSESCRDEPNVLCRRLKVEAQLSSRLPRALTAITMLVTGTLERRVGS